MNEPLLEEFQPDNGDVMCDGELLKGVYPPKTGTPLLCRKYLWHSKYHQEDCHPVIGMGRVALEKPKKPEKEKRK